jgi:hypothetical protein
VSNENPRLQPGDIVSFRLSIRLRGRGGPFLFLEGASGIVKENENALVVLVEERSEMLDYCVLCKNAILGWASEEYVSNA